MVANTEAYVDTSALISAVDESDTYHSTFARLFANPPRMVTTPLVIYEGHAWCLRRYGIRRALSFLAMIEELKPLKVLNLPHAQVKASSELLRRFSDQDLTLADALGLYLMQERDISSCWSTDFHLGLTGVPLVIHEA